jgi:hypothetical protein
MKLEIWDSFLNSWLDCSGLTLQQLRDEAEQCEVMYKVDGVIKSWKDR